MIEEIIFVFFLLILLLLLGKNNIQEQFTIMKYDPNMFSKQLENNLESNNSKKNSVRDFNYEEIKYYKTPYKCLNYEDILLNE
jgi:hypothetical protein